MLLNLTDILTNEGKTDSFEVSYEERFYKRGKGLMFKVLDNEPFTLKLINMGKGKACISGVKDYRFEARCDRCLCPVQIDVHIEIEENISAQEIENPTDADDYPFMEGFELDTQVLIDHEIMINWPVKILCKEDCKGICPNCGKDLNQGECGCDTFVPDPRMAVLNEIFNANKEV